jgi:hypothetical protein
MLYNMTLTLQAKDNPPVDQPYGKNMTAIEAAHAVTQALAMAASGRTGDFDPETLMIRLDLVR